LLFFFINSLLILIFQPEYRGTSSPQNFVNICLTHYVTKLKTGQRSFWLVIWRCLVRISAAMYIILRFLVVLLGLSRRMMK
jgi:hypothetical protein